MSNTDHTSPARRFLLLVIVSFLVAGLIGVYWETHVQPAYRAIRTHEDGRLSTLVLTEERRLSELFGFAASVHDAALAGTVVVPDDDALDRFLLENLAQVDVVVESYDPTLRYDPTDLFDANATIRGIGVVAESGASTPWFVVWREGSEVPRRLRYFTRRNKTVLIDELLLEEEQP